MTRSPELKRADRCNQNVKHERRWSNDPRREPEQSHRRDVTGRTGMADRRVKECDHADGQNQKSEMRRIHVMLYVIAGKLSVEGRMTNQ